MASSTLPLVWSLITLLISLPLNILLFILSLRHSPLKMGRLSVVLLQNLVVADIGILLTGTHLI